MIIPIHRGDNQSGNDLPLKHHVFGGRHAWNDKRKSWTVIIMICLAIFLLTTPLAFIIMVNIPGSIPPHITILDPSMDHRRKSEHYDGPNTLPGGDATFPMHRVMTIIQEEEEETIVSETTIIRYRKGADHPPRIYSTAESDNSSSRSLLVNGMPELNRDALQGRRLSETVNTADTQNEMGLSQQDTSTRGMKENVFVHVDDSTGNTAEEVPSFPPSLSSYAYWAPSLTPTLRPSSLQIMDVARAPTSIVPSSLPTTVDTETAPEVGASGKPKPETLIGIPSLPPSSTLLSTAVPVGMVDDINYTSLPPTSSESLYSSDHDSAASNMTNVTLEDDQRTRNVTKKADPNNTNDSSNNQTAETSNGNGFTPSKSLQNSETASTDYAISAVMVGLASSVIVCAVFLYCADLRDKRRHENWMRERKEMNELQDDNSSMKSVILEDGDVEEDISTNSSGSGGGAAGGYWIQAMMRDLVSYGGPPATSKYMAPPNILPPILRGGEEDIEQRDDVDGSNFKDGRGGKYSNVDDLSISRVSTLTTSIMEGSYYFSVDALESMQDKEEGDDVPLHPQQRVYEMSELNISAITSNKTTARGLLLSTSDDENSASVCSSLTDGTSDTTHTATLFGEECVGSYNTDESREESTTGIITPEDSTTDLIGALGMSLSENSPTDVEQRFPASNNGQPVEPDCRDDVSFSEEMTKLEKIIASINATDGENHPQRDVINDSTCPNHRPPRPIKRRDPTSRDVYFVPPSSGVKGNIGLVIDDPNATSSHPFVSKVDLGSTFVGRIFVGDTILRVNDTDTLDMSGEEILKLIATSENPPPDDSSDIYDSTKQKERMIKMIKLTVISCEDTLVTKSDSPSVDSGMTDGREEV